MNHSCSLPLSIHQLSHLIHRELEHRITEASPQLKELNITSINGRVIGFLFFNQQRHIFQKDIEDVLEIRRSTASTLLQGMENKGLLRREAVEYDARLKRLVLTNILCNHFYCKGFF